MFLHSENIYLVPTVCHTLSFQSDTTRFPPIISIFNDVFQTHLSNMKAWVFERINKSIKYIKILYSSLIQNQKEF